jgi:hypothetical protein
MVSRCTVPKEKLYTLFAALANRGLETVAYYERGNVIGLLLLHGYLVEVSRAYTAADPQRMAETLATYLPRRAVSRDYDPMKVPEVSPRTAAWWQFLRWLRQAQVLEVQPCQ